jgi:hypothetical protein
VTGLPVRRPDLRRPGTGSSLRTTETSAAAVEHLEEEHVTETDLRQEEYVQRLRVSALRREVFGQSDPSASADLLDALLAAETELTRLEGAAGAGRDRDSGGPPDDGMPGAGVLVTRGRVPEVRGMSTTGLEAHTSLHMAQVPTSIYHLFTRETNPLLSCTIHSRERGRTRRLRIVSFLEGYSARAVDTVEFAGETTVAQLPTLFPDRLRDVTELTSATLNVLVEDLDGKVELHSTQRVPLLARTTAPLAVRDPSTGGWNDMTRFFGAFVTPNAPAIMSFLREVADQHPKRILGGYQLSEEDVNAQVEAIFAALKAHDITYVNSVIAFSPEEGTATQRVRLPRESLADREANCIDGTVLVASVLEALSLNPAIVVVPGHAFVGWETWPGSNLWRYLETTMIGSHTFAEACAAAEDMARRYQSIDAETGTESRFRRWELRRLRTREGLTPME